MTRDALSRQSASQFGRFCQGCDAELPPKTWQGRDQKWCSERCRKDTLYAGTCVECGGKTNGSNGPGTAAERCLECIKWTPEQILAGIKRWSAAHEGKAPTMADAEPGRDGHGLFPDRGHTRLYGRLFGSWNGALVAAGLSVNQDKSQETFEAIVTAVRSGEATVDIAARHGVTPRAIAQRLYNHGTSIREERRHAARIG